MGFALKDIAYGWKIGVAAVLTGATIFVADNIRQRIYQRDFVEIALGVHERALATQYQTNPVVYYVDPPSFVRNWYSNDYVATVTNGVTNWTAVLYTNTYTNVISARTDRAMAAALDAKIKALIPYYADTNSVFDGTTNIVMLTVTGLWASLGIGDGTNQFTSVPEWIGTNGVTNAATYGELPWRIYKEDLEERYKVLNALKIYKPTCSVSNFYYAVDGTSDTWASAKSIAEGEWTAHNYGYSNISYYKVFSDYDGQRTATNIYTAAINVTTGYVFCSAFQTNVDVNRLEIKMKAGPLLGYTNPTFDNRGISGLTSNGTWDTISTLFQYQSDNKYTYFASLATPDACNEPTELWQPEGRGFESQNQIIVLIYLNFQYCTNKYW